MRVKKYITLFCLALASTLHCKDILVYHKTTGTTTLTTTYTCTKDKDGITIETSNKDQQTEAISSPSYKLMSFHCNYIKNKDHSKFTLKDGILTAQGVIKGEALKESYHLKGTSWIQEFEFGLQPFLASNKSSWLFDILHPKNFKLHKMVAKKQGIESFTLDNKIYQAQLVHITLQGVKSMFWKAELWYDTKTHDLLMYKSNEGPHTPNVTITLASKTTTMD